MCIRIALTEHRGITRKQASKQTRHTDRQADGQTDRRTERQTDRWGERERGHNIEPRGMVVEQ